VIADDRFAVARKVADAVLYEGYLLYPYRASARKNQLRWQFGLVAPRPFAETDPSEDWWMQTECLLEAGIDAQVDVRVRFLRVQERRVERAVGDVFEPVASLDVDGNLLMSWDEGVEQELDVPDLSLSTLLMGEHAVPVELGEAEEREPVRDAGGTVVGQVVRRSCAASGTIRVSAGAVPGPYPLVTLKVRIENQTAWNAPAPTRDDVARRSFVGVHTLLAVRDGAFISLADPPEFARPLAATCSNVHAWPVLIGEVGQRDVVLSSPVTLSDYPQIAPESPGDMFDATEIDEILALRVMTLSDEEKREARSTDPRAASIIDRCDFMPAEMMERLHGAVRYLRGAGPDPVRTEENDEKPWWDPSVDAEVDPFADQVWVGTVSVGRGSRVRLRPARRADAHDLFLAGRDAMVEAVIHDVDGNVHLAVNVIDDDVPVELGHGRHLYFSPDEVEPLVGAD
jgi:hypothetical protein